jgi:hypothetical protein
MRGYHWDRPDPLHVTRSDPLNKPRLLVVYPREVLVFPGCDGGITHAFRSFGAAYTRRGESPIRTQPKSRPSSVSETWIARV